MPIDRTILATIRHHWYNESFNVLDTDRNGFLTGVDAGDELHRMGYDHTDQLRLFDMNDDGKLDLDEFVALYKTGEEAIERGGALARRRRGSETLDSAPVLLVKSRKGGGNEVQDTLVDDLTLFGQISY